MSRRKFKKFLAQSKRAGVLQNCYRTRRVVNYMPLSIARKEACYCRSYDPTGLYLLEYSDFFNRWSVLMVMTEEPTGRLT